MLRWTLTGLRFAFRWSRRFTLLIVILGMLAFNVAALTISGVNAIASGAIAAVAGAQATVAGRNAAKARSAQAAAESQRRAARRIGNRIAGRTARVAGANVASAAGEALPVVGIGVIAAATAYELKAACDTMRDLSEVDRLLAPDAAEAEPHTETEQVCGMTPPSREEIAARIRSAPGQAWQKATALHADLPDWQMPGWFWRESSPEVTPGADSPEM